MFKIVYKNQIIFETKDDNTFFVILSLLSLGYEGRYILLKYSQYSTNLLKCFFSLINIDYELYPYKMDSLSTYIDYFGTHPELDKNFVNQQISEFLSKYPRFIIYFFSKLLFPYSNPFYEYESLSIDLKDFFFKDYHFIYLLIYSIRESIFLKIGRQSSNISTSDIDGYLESLIKFTYSQFGNNKNVPIFHRLIYFIVYHSYIIYNKLISYINLIKEKIYNLSIIQWIISHEFYIYIESKPILKNTIYTIPFTLLLYLGYNWKIGFVLIFVKYYIGLRFLKLFIKWIPEIFQSLYCHTLKVKLWHFFEFPIIVFLHLSVIIGIGYLLLLVSNYFELKPKNNLAFLTIQTFAFIKHIISPKIMAAVNWVKLKIFAVRYEIIFVYLYLCYSFLWF
jgi:hypothetical protein